MNTFGRIFRVSIFGESHGVACGVLIDGCPAGVPLCEADFENDLQRRKPGATATTTRIEEDKPLLVSGVYNGHTTGAPILIQFEQKNVRSADYDTLKNSPRPGHADMVLQQKHRGFNDHRGGGHSSGRLTVALVAAGVVAKKLIPSVTLSASVVAVGGSSDIAAALQEAVRRNDSVGGLVRCQVNGLPAGWGEPFFDTVESMISHVVFAIPAVKGISFGSGFAAAAMWGCEHNDAIIDANGKTQTNNAGGINGGITNGNEMYFDVAIKPASSTPQLQHTWNHATQAVAPLQVLGRHDLCIALRAPVVVEAAAAIALADLKIIDDALRLVAVQK